MKFLHLVLITLITTLAYSNIFANDFVGDDPGFMKDWELTQSWDHIPELLTGAVPLGHEKVYRPVRSLIYLGMYQAFGPTVWVYHVYSLLIHLTVTILVFFISRHLFRSSLPATVAALLFGTHPIHTEAITFMTTSFDITGIALMLGSFLCYLKSQEHKNTRTQEQRSVVSGHWFTRLSLEAIRPEILAGKVVIRSRFLASLPTK